VQSGVARGAAAAAAAIFMIFGVKNTTLPAEF
jgi:hypothetical protein